MNKKKMITVALALLIVISGYSLFFAQPHFFVASINLIFHEAGHWIFALFGRFILVLGGFLGEAMIPLIFSLYFYRRSDLPGQIFGFAWLSAVFHGTAIYVADARARLLPLIGGQDGHDWAYLLGRLSLLESDIFISNLFMFGGFLSLLWAVYLLFKYHNRIYTEEVVKKVYFT